MKDSSTSVATVPFHGDELFLIEHGGQPYAPMKAIVKGMGLGWQAQHRKLSENSERWGVIKMVIPPLDAHNDATCIPVRKLPGWLMTISPNKIKNPVVRDKVVTYQNECDDALWDYWTQGVAINPRIPLTPDHQHGIQKAVARRAQSMPKPVQRLAFSRLYGHLKDRFQVGTYKDIDDARYTEALAAIQTYEIEGELLPSEPVEDTGISADSDLSDIYIMLCHVHWLCHFWRDYDMDKALRMLRSPAASQMCEHMSMAETYKNRIARMQGELLQVSRARLGMTDSPLPIH